MREFQDRRRIRKFLHSRYAIAVLMIVCAFLARAVWGVYEKYNRSEALRSKAEQELAALENRERALTSALSSLDTEQGREREIRDLFGVAKEGERLVIIVPDEKSVTEGISEDGKGWWSWFTGFFARD